ncbi:hypothetical protein EII29_07720 [Leptotrichia sp. OH3620_COT-345]|uniref:hypothetical protein n=1 Tax=Leptotrichia sp. OH3620_COT-345 TaxID=2491048 RepID=UPI000F64B6FB|nr:hypothetical protein [Leptotrichia sp. OH3620_COT-345]RRD39286.1 hypothetical protein EII29_07720 [Leptotrichia sp. OH3620_COT-345]
MITKRFIWESLALVTFLAAINIILIFVIKKQDPPKGYKIRIKEVIYYVDTYIMDGEYLIFQDEFGREVEVHKNFVSIEEIKE